jgi:hypothetical protein
VLSEVVSLSTGKFYFNRKYFTDSKVKWVSFESNPRLDMTRKNIYGKCVPCIASLYEQLKMGKEEVDLGAAYNCWKVVAILGSLDECLELLSVFEKMFLKKRHIMGRFGSGDERKPTKVIVFNAANAKDRDRLLGELKICAEKTGLKVDIFSHRGCAELYHELLGDSKDWKKTEKIKNTEVVPYILDRIQKMLYWR